MAVKEENKAEVPPKQGTGEAAVNTPPAGSTGAPAGEEAPPDYKAQLIAMIGKVNPDLKVSDDNLHQVAGDVIGGLHDKVGKYEAANNDLGAFFDSEPELMSAIAESKKSGKPFAKVLPKHMDIQAMIPKEGDTDETDYTAAVADRKKKYADKQAKAAQLENNRKKSVDTINGFVKDNNMDEKESGDFIDFITNLLKKLDSGNFDANTLASLRKIQTYENDMQNAKKEGEVRGRNEKIVATREKKNDAGDGLPSISSAATETAPKPQTYVGKINEEYNNNNPLKKMNFTPNKDRK